MSVIIRLQNLPWSANALDIREFFKGLNIPEGGVHIVGGEQGDAFMAFSSDEDARLAMQKSGTSLKGIQITLLLSSRTEMQKVIESARQQALGIQSFMAPVAPVAPVQPTPPPQPPVAQQQPHLQSPGNMQGQPPPQRMPPNEHAHPQSHPSQNVYPSRPIQPGMGPGPGPGPHGHTFPQPFNAQQPGFASHMPYPGQKVSGYPPGVVVPQSGMPPQVPQNIMPPQVSQSGMPPQVSQSGMPPQFYGQPPPMGAIPTTPSVPHPMQNQNMHINNTPPNMAHVGFPAGHQTPNYTMSPQSVTPQPQLQQDLEEEKRDKKLVSSSSSIPNKDKRDRDTKSREERRRRSKSRSRSKDRDRDRRRRHRSRSRSRSRDKGGRRRRSRSRERDRTRDRDRQRDRKDNRSYREKSERSSQEVIIEPQEKVPENSGGIPGLGEIPDDIPKEGLSIFTQPSDAPIQTKETPPNSNWNTKSANAPEIQPMTPHQPQRQPHLEQQRQLPPEPQRQLQPEPQRQRQPQPEPQQQRQSQPEPQRQMQSQPPPQPQSFNQPPQVSEKPQPPKPFLLANPPNPPLLSDPPAMKAPSVNAGHSPYVGNDSSFKDGPPGYKPPLLQHPKEENSHRDYPPEERRDWPNDSVDRRRYREDDRNYRGNYNRDRNYDSPKPHSNSWDNSREPDNSQPHGDWGRPYPRREDDYRYNRDKDDGLRNQAPGMHQERRDHMYATRSFGGTGNFNDYNSEYDDRYARGGFRGRGRRGGFGRENERGPEPPRMGDSFKDENSSYRDRYVPEFDRNRGGRGLLRGRGGGRGPPISDYPRERRDRTCSVELRNVPTNAGHIQIRDLFTGIMVPHGNIKILGGERGERIGVVLVQFSSPRDAFEATKRSGGYINDTRVDVWFVDDAIYEGAKDVMAAANDSNNEGGVEQMDIPSSCVYVSGLPIGCTDHDVAKLFENFKVENVILELEKGSRQPSGGCFVRFVSPEEAENALSEMKHPNLDGTPVKVEVCTMEAMDTAAKEREKIKNRPQPPPPQNQEKNPSEIGTKEHLLALTQQLKNAENTERKKNSSENSESSTENGDQTSPKKGADLLTDSIVLKNVLSDITETSIRDFFSDEGLIPEKIYFNRPDSEGKCDVFVIFPKISDAKHALKKNSQLLGSTEVHVELISKPTVMVAMGLPFDPRELFQKGHSEQDPGDVEEYDPHDRLTSVDNNHSTHVERDNRGYNPRYSRQHNDSNQLGYRPRPPFHYRRDSERYPPERGSYDDRVSSNGVDISTTTAPPIDFGKPGCVVALSNLPYHATTEDILSFFKEFGYLRPENIIRRYDERNRPTADSRVCLASPEEAGRAVKTLSREYILGRPIYLSHVN